MKEHGIDAEHFLTQENANRVFNLDESGFPLGGSNKLKVIDERARPLIYCKTTENKGQITVLGCVSDDGHFEKPYVIFPGQRPSYNISEADRKKYDLGRSKSGWISTAGSQIFSSTLSRKEE